MTNFSVGHETLVGALGAERLAFSAQHIEVDNRLSWILGRLDEAYGDEAVYVHLTREASATAESYHQRWHLAHGIMRAYARGVLQRDDREKKIASDLVETVDSNIRFFLRNKTRVHRINIEDPQEGFVGFWKAIGAEGSLDRALDEFKQFHNASITSAQVHGAQHAQAMNPALIPQGELDSFTEQLGAALNAARSELSSTQAELKRRHDMRLKDLEIIAGLRVRNRLQRAQLISMRERLAALRASRTFKLGEILLQHIRRPWRWPRAGRELLELFGKRPEPAGRRSHPLTEEYRPALVEASLLARSEGKRPALAHAERYADAREVAALPLFRASLSASDAEWTNHLNAYLAPRFTSAELFLSQTPGPRFQRLRASDDLPRVDGPLISVIMPAFNAEATLLHAADSVLAQTWKNLELLIVDDCSKDRTLEIATALAARDSRVRVLRNDVNVGPYVSKNRALQLARGALITGHDADDWCLPNRIEADFAALRAGGFGGGTACLSKMIAMDKEGSFVFRRASPSSLDGAMTRASISLTKEADFLRNALGGWDSVRFSADSELICRAELLLGEKLLHLDRVGMICLVHEGSLTNHLVHGTNPTMGVSLSRRQYQEAYKDWHVRASPSKLKMGFPLTQRPFPAPEAMCVGEKLARRVLATDEALPDRHLG